MKKKKHNTQQLPYLLPILTFLMVGFLFIISNSYTPKWNFKWKGIRKEVKDSVQRLDRIGEISSDSISQYGYRLDSYFIHKWLIENVKPLEFYKLLDYPNGTVKAVAYEGLMYNNKVKKYPLFMKSLNDTLAFVYYRSGCIGSGAMLSDYVINFITNIDHQAPPKYNPPIIELTLEEKEEILTLFKKRKAKEKYYFEEFYKIIR
ncbi:hypothetical protein [Tenacibaculum amylolyticum]|uniref:hypothetical protein n=1 Tax=Tenacibaculum amylolyticum TaxID=104269 RepID=UPI003895189C